MKEKERKAIEALSSAEFAVLAAVLRRQLGENDCDYKEFIAIGMKNKRR